MSSSNSLLPMSAGGMSRTRKGRFYSASMKIITFITPSFIHPILQHESSSLTPAHSHATPVHLDTAYLDGLRGLAALIVYIFHFLVPFDRAVLLGYIPSTWGTSIFGLPILGLFRSGTAVVLIFFLISGYVLTLSASRCCHNGDWDGALRSLSAATLKRGVRLFLPAVVTSFVIMLLVSGGLYADKAQIAHLPAHWPPLGPTFKASFGEQAKDWLEFVVGRLTNPWVWYEEVFSEPEPSYYGAHLWTIQNEFHCSMILFLVAMTLSRVPSLRARGALWAGITVYSALWGRWDVALFLCGTAFADSDVRSTMTGASMTGQPGMVKPTWLTARKYSPYLAMAGHAAALVAGLWLASYPEKRGREAVGFGLIGTIHPSAQPWNAIGAALIVWSVRRVRLARALLTTSLMQYLGQVSFAFYIVHEPLLQTLGWLYADKLRKYFILAGGELGFREEAGAQIGLWLAFFSFTPLVFIMADYVWRGLDRPSMMLVKMIGRQI
ncbi:acyltransferase [Trichoderma arundinaceum]|uniref:Acyltransferase n=1 Tax=Trichoderma arundinaceum TaxID=490622 RepID=A0A395N7V6_TRIAR|nr:acyltransferase [Trichoderma arundinaceum]